MLCHGTSYFFTKTYNAANHSMRLPRCDFFMATKRRQPLPSVAEQRQRLKAKGIPTRGLSKWTIYRRYNYYIRQRHPASDPLALAYGEQKKLSRRLEQGGEKTIITGTGKKTTARTYIKNIDKKTRRQVKKNLPNNISGVIFSHRFKSQKREDRFRYSFDRSGLVVNATNVTSVLQHLKTVIIPDLMETIDLLYSKRGRFYDERAIGALIIYDTKNMPDSPIPRPVTFTTREEFPNYLWDMLYALLVIDILRNYKDAIITLRHLDIYIRTRTKPTSVEQML